MNCYQIFGRFKIKCLDVMGALSVAHLLLRMCKNKAFVQNKGGQALENYKVQELSNLLASNRNLSLAYKVKQNIPKILNMTINYLNMHRN